MHVVVKDAGLIMRSNGFLGCSPDGIIYNHTTAEQGLLEIKCLISAEKTPLLDVAQQSSHFCLKVNSEGELRLKTSHNYYYQIQGGMAIAKLDWCDFVLWTPTELCVEKVKFDKEAWQEMEKKLISFYHKSMVPELLKSGHRIPL